MTATANAAEIVFTMGLPGAGKSTVATAHNPNHRVIDPDIHKENHPDYDPKNPHLLHEWSTEMADREWDEAMTRQAGEWLVATTGTNHAHYGKRMREAQARGFRVRLFYVRVTLETSLRRNAARERNVPEEIVYKKAGEIAEAFEALSAIADEVEIVDNDTDWNQKEAA